MCSFILTNLDLLLPEDFWFQIWFKFAQSPDSGEIENVKRLQKDRRLTINSFLKQGHFSTGSFLVIFSHV